MPPRATRTEPAYSFLYEPEALPASGWTEAEIASAMEAVAPLLPNPLNLAQLAAVAASFRERRSLVWGPPGTGKTEVLAAIAMAWALACHRRRAPARIAVGAFTHKAIENLLRAIDRGLAEMAGAQRPDVVYLISPLTESPTDVPARVVARSSAEADDLAAALMSPGPALIVASTWMQLSKLAPRPHVVPWFDLVLLDEASQMKTAAAAGYFALLRTTGHVVLGGDHAQLGPVYKYAQEADTTGLLDSIYQFSRNAQRTPTTQLTLNYRTNATIATYPSQRFYAWQYEAHFPDRRLDLACPTEVPVGWPALLPWSALWARLLDPQSPVTVLTYPAGGATVSNLLEASVVACLASLYRLLLHAPGGAPPTAFWQQQLGIVATHRAQTATLKQLLRSTGLFPDFVAATVDVFQGQERDLMVVSYTVSDRDFIRAEDAFLLDPRRFNVALTRARMKCVMLMSRAITEHLPADREVAEVASHLQQLTHAYCRPVEGWTAIPYVSDEGAQVEPHGVLWERRDE